MKISNKQKIYFSTYDDIKNPFYGGGGAVAIHEIAKRLSKKFDVRVISWDYNGKKHEIIESITYEKFGLSFVNPKAGMFMYQLFLPFVMIQKKYDMWFESFCPPFTTAFLPLYTTKPVIGIVHMLAAEDMERKYKLPFHVIQNKGIKTYKNLVATSESIKKNIKTISAKTNISVISNGISKVVTPKMNKQKYILFLGRIEIDQKGLDLLLTAFKLFYENNKNYKLIIAGNGDPKEVKKLKELLKNENFERQVELKGKVSGKIKESLLMNAACLVISSRFETFSLVALEAMAYGAPILCFSIRGLSWVPKDLAIKVKAFSVNDLSIAITDVISNNKKTAKMIQSANEFVKQYSWDSIAQKYALLIETNRNNKKV